MLLLPPIAHLERISLDELNRALVSWGHKMGPLQRPNNREWSWGLHHNGELVAVIAASDMIKEPSGGFRRTEAYELARVCAARRDLCRVAVRMFREFIHPSISETCGFGWVISYQDSVVHSGDLYRFDGWVPLLRSRSGNDARSGKKGRNKIVWGWCADPAVRAAARGASPFKQAA